MAYFCSATNASNCGALWPIITPPFTKPDDAAIVRQALANVHEVLNAPDNCLTPAEKQGLLAKVIEAIYPENGEGLRITLKPPININQTVSYFTIYATFKSEEIHVSIDIVSAHALDNAA